MPLSVKEELIFWKNNVRCLNGRPFRYGTIVYSDETDVGAGGVIKGRDGVTSLGPLTRWATALPGASFRRSMFPFLVFLKHYLVAQCSGLLITVTFHLSFALVA